MFQILECFGFTYSTVNS
uniref:Uncharacterized protein n=1 Tax=Anguilla anguilla TaxID=7936 RepID=A0A0E9QGZ7_ANGAN